MEALRERVEGEVDCTIIFRAGIDCILEYTYVS